MIMNDELLKMLPMSEIDADIHSSVPGYWQQTKRPSIWSAYKGRIEKVQYYVLS